MKLPGLLLVSMLFLIMQGLAAPSSRDSLKNRLEKIEDLLNELQTEVNSLNQELSHLPEAQTPDQSTAGIDTSQPPSNELLTLCRQAVKKVTAARYHQTAAGISFSSYLPFGFNLVHWMDKWGVKGELGADWEKGVDDSFFGGRLYALRSFHTFSFFRKNPLAFHLYGLGGAGFNSSNKTYSNPPDFSAMRGPMNEEGWEYEYDTPDRSIELLIGAAVEISFPFLGGVTFTPDVSYKGSYFFSRYQDSPIWKDLNPNWRDEAPDSDFSIGFTFGSSFYFYFR